MSARIRFSSKEGKHLNLFEVRRAFISYLVIKKMRGLFVFRIDNVNCKENKNLTNKIEALSDLNWLGLIPDESNLNPDPRYAPYMQNERLDIYQRYIDALIKMGVTYKKALSHGNELSKRAMQPALYLTANNFSDDYILDLKQEKVLLNKQNVSEFVIVNPNGLPSDDFAEIIDDYLMGITHVIIDKNRIDSIACYLAVYRYFNWKIPSFLVLPFQKSNKEIGDYDFLHSLQNEGYLPDAICHYLYELDVDCPCDKKHSKIKELIEDFHIDKLHDNHRLFDIEALRRVNAQHIKKTTPTEFLAFIRPFINGYVNEEHNDDYLLKLATIHKSQITFGNQIKEFLSPFLLEKPSFSPSEMQLINSPQSIAVISSMYSLILEKESAIDNILQEMSALQSSLGVRGKDFYMPLRLLLSRTKHGPELDSIIKFLGKDEVLKRLCQYKD
ncbi:MAG: glutamate--tRNA ligase family protein [Bacilli bacterium]|jgi:nondiscriminating glutamyl-tRNA synthetase|nr:glutamate--tRNA ligase family protein [Bacilli bacterium]MDD4005638.1 glutamate--tRNA ligase family protein [Bacilli bacterium]